MSLFFYETVMAFIGGIFDSPAIVKEAIRRNRKIVMTNGKFFKSVFIDTGHVSGAFQFVGKVRAKARSVNERGRR